MKRLTRTTLLLSLLGFTLQASSINAQANLRAVQQADTLVQNYQNALSHGDPVIRKNAALQLQSNPVAVQRANASKSNFFKKKLNEDLNAIRNKTKGLIKQKVAAEYGVSPDEVTFFEATNKNTKRKKGFKPKNKVKVGQDWDVTVRVKGKDIPIDKSRSAVETSFYEACNGKPPKNATNAKSFAKKQHVEVTNRTHTESYGFKKGEGEKIISGSKSATDFDSQHVSKVVKFKSDNPAKEAEEVLNAARKKVHQQKLKGNAARKEMLKAKTKVVGLRREQCRQGSKQFINQGAKRAKALGGKVPKHLAKQASVIKKLGNGILTYEEGVVELRNLGTTIEDALTEMADLTESAVKLNSGKSVVPSCKGKVKPRKKKGFFSKVKSLFSGSDDAAKTTLMKSGSVKKALGTSSLILSGVTVAGMYSEGLLEEKREAAKHDRDYSHTMALGNVFKNAVVLPATMIKQGLESTVGAAAARTRTVLHEEGEKGHSTLKTFGNAMIKLSEDFLDKRDEVLVQGIQMGGQLHDYVSEDPMRFAGDVTMINAIAENWHYGYEEDRAAFRQLKNVGTHTYDVLSEKMNKMSSLRSKICDVVFSKGLDSPSLNTLATEYKTAHGKVKFAKSKWKRYKSNWKGAGADEIIAHLDNCLRGMIRVSDRLPEDPIDYACKIQRQAVGPLKVSISAPSETFIRTKTTFKVTVSGGMPPYSIFWQGSNGLIIDQQLKRNGSRSCWIRFADPGEHTVSLMVSDSCAESQIISSENGVNVKNYFVKLLVPEEPIAPGTAFPVQVNITGGTPPYDFIGTISGTVDKQSVKVSQTAPDEQGSYKVQVKVTDSEGLAYVAGDAIRVEEPLGLHFIIPQTSTQPEGEVTAYFIVKGGTPPFILSDAASGETSEREGDFRLKGPKEPGVYEYTLTVRDANGSSFSKTRPLEVRGPFMAELKGPSGPVSPGEQVKVPITITGGTPPFKLTLQASGTLQSHKGMLNLTAAKDVGVHPFTVMVSDKDMNITMATCKITVMEGFTLSVTPSKKTTTPGKSVPFSLAIKGGKPPFTLRGAATGTYSERNLKFNYPAGSKPAVYNSYVTCTDADNRLGRATFTVVVKKAPKPETPSGTSTTRKTVVTKTGAKTNTSHASSSGLSVHLEQVSSMMDERGCVHVKYKVTGGKPPYIRFGVEYRDGQINYRSVESYNLLGDWDLDRYKEELSYFSAEDRKNKRFFYEYLIKAEDEYEFQVEDRNAGTYKADVVIQDSDGKLAYTSIKVTTKDEVIKVREYNEEFHRYRAKNLRHGPAKSFFQSGKLKTECNYSNGKYQGAYKEYYDSGQLKMEVNYSSGKKDGSEKAYYPNGQVKYHHQYVRGNLHGLARLWFETGQLGMEARFANDKPVGNYTRWNKEGEEVEPQPFKHDDFIDPVNCMRFGRIYGY